MLLLMMMREEDVIVVQGNNVLMSDVLAIFDMVDNIWQYLTRLTIFWSKTCVFLLFSQYWWENTVVSLRITDSDTITQIPQVIFIILEIQIQIQIQIHIKTDMKIQMQILVGKHSGQSSYH